MTHLPPARLHPCNPKVLEFRGRPRALLTATEHYGAVLNRPFRFRRYLADAARHGMTVTRLFTLFRELQTPINPYSTCKPESPDYIAPFCRVGPGTARDGQLKFDLARWNDEFFDRLHQFITAAGEHDIIVELTLLSCTYSENIWSLNPLHADNNINDLPAVPWQKYTSTHDAVLFDWQCRHVRRIVEETRHYDNLIYEVCNEPAGGDPSHPDNPTPAEVDAWQARIVELIRAVEGGPAQRHLVSGQQCAVFPRPGLTENEVGQPNGKAFDSLPFDIVNVHPLALVSIGGKRYDMGLFMAGQSRLGPLRDFALDTWELPRALDYNEDNCAAQYKDEAGWTIHRKRAWTTMLSGAHYDMIDFSIWPGVETGSPGARRMLRPWFGILSQFLHSMDLARARPRRGIVKCRPAPVVESVLAVGDEDYAIYLADGREVVEPDGPCAGDPIQGHLELEIAPGRFSVSSLSPVTGVWSAPQTFEVARRGDPLTIPLAPFCHDLLIRVRAAEP